ncbi:hypothetical protein [Sunxiuqinia elliptica]|uniref:Uncharacterized protein n=1 Tax=Sunxiuqinia elliptica TaxID=655355 RepID=A0A4R6HAN9_9BACT|nr:hypothetical protein [Sunxiuqinia elliptica]TDO05430.1 hypothetical protein DET52_101790 [Sunxiuqinia elliptica]TDO64976.1 hypothetical protein DET65_1349 [Sunxiuqinia elliptica]
MEYFEPDSRWELYQVTSAEEYVDKFVVKGKFHCAVPSDIQDAWQTVEYILAHAYYHWPMYDEGFKKALLIIEMAVKLKAKKQNIPISGERNKNGKTFEKKLSRLIDELFSAEHYLNLKTNIDRARRIRNHQVHPQSHTYMGGMGNIKSNLRLIVNVLNDIFRNEEKHVECYNRTLELSRALSIFDKSLLVLEHDEPSILIEQILDFSLRNNKLYLFLNPVRININEILSHHYSLNPKVVCLEKFQMDKNELKGVSSKGTKIRIYKTEKPENQKVFNDYLMQIAEADKIDWVTCYSVLKHNTGWEKVKLIYEDLIPEPTIAECNPRNNISK